MCCTGLKNTCVVKKRQICSCMRSPLTRTQQHFPMLRYCPLGNSAATVSHDVFDTALVLVLFHGGHGGRSRGSAATRNPGSIAEGTRRSSRASYRRESSMRIAIRQIQLVRLADACCDPSWRFGRATRHLYSSTLGIAPCSFMRYLEARTYMAATARREIKHCHVIQHHVLYVNNSTLPSEVPICPYHMTICHQQRSYFACPRLEASAKTVENRWPTNY